MNEKITGEFEVYYKLNGSNDEELIYSKLNGKPNVTDKNSD